MLARFGATSRHTPLHPPANQLRIAHGLRMSQVISAEIDTSGAAEAPIAASEDARSAARTALDCLARVANHHGIDLPVERLRLLLMVMYSLVIAVSMKIVGVLLITAMLIIPAATARPFSRSPERMAILAAILGAVSVFGGLWTSWITDAPAGPAVVMAAFILFLLGVMSGRARAV